MNTTSKPARTNTNVRYLKLGLAAIRLGPFLILLLLAAIIAACEPVFFTQRNIFNVMVQSSVIAITAMGVLIVILTGGIDLSIGSVLALSTVLGALAYHSLNVGAALTMITMIAVGTAAGLINGIVYVKWRMPHPFIVTLAMMSIARGLAMFFASGRPIPGMPGSIRWLGSGHLGPIPAPVLLVALVGVLLYVLTTKLVWGNWIYAYGGNNEGARDVGIPVDRLLISAYALCGLCAGTAALITAGRTDSGFPTAATLGELDAIAAVIIGGASFLGGRGSVINAIVGAVIIGTIRNGMNLIGINTYFQAIVLGIVIVLAVRLDVARQRMEERFQAWEALNANQ